MAATMSFFWGGCFLRIVCVTDGVKGNNGSEKSETDHQHKSIYTCAAGPLGNPVFLLLMFLLLFLKDFTLFGVWATCNNSASTLRLNIKAM